MRSLDLLFSACGRFDVPSRLCSPPLGFEHPDFSAAFRPETMACDHMDSLCLRGLPTPSEAPLELSTVRWGRKMELPPSPTGLIKDGFPLVGRNDSKREVELSIECSMEACGMIEKKTNRPCKVTINKRKPAPPSLGLRPRMVQHHLHVWGVQTERCAVPSAHPPTHEAHFCVLGSCHVLHGEAASGASSRGDPLPCRPHRDQRGPRDGSLRRAHRGRSLGRCEVGR